MADVVFGSLRVEDVAQMLGCNPQQVSRWARRGLLRGRRLPQKGRAWVFTREDVDAFLEGYGRDEGGGVNGRDAAERVKGAEGGGSSSR